MKTKNPLSKKWNVHFYKKITKYLNINLRTYLRRAGRTIKGQTMPDLSTLNIGHAKSMKAAILFFDLEDFTATSSAMSNEDTLFVLNNIIPSLTRIVRYWGGTIEKNTGDGIMAILGTETSEDQTIAREAIECAMAMRYIMLTEIQKILADQNLPVLNFRIGIDMGEVLIARIGIKNTNFITVVGDAANRASKLQTLSKTNGISIGENITKNLDEALYQYLEAGVSPKWNWIKEPSSEPYKFFHYTLHYPDPKKWRKFKFN